MVPLAPQLPHPAVDNRRLQPGENGTYFFVVHDLSCTRGVESCRALLAQRCSGAPASPARVFSTGSAAAPPP